MRKAYWQWSKEDCIKEVLKYKTRSDFRRECKEVYYVAKSRGWLTELYSYIPTQLHWSKTDPEGYRKWRKKWREKNKKHLLDYGRKERFKRLYGIDLSAYNDKIKKQKNRCAICGKHEDEQKKALALDHNHKTNNIRDLLCNNCNTGLGYFHDNIEVLMKAMRYLNKHNKLDNPDIIKEENKKRFTVTVYLENYERTKIYNRI